MPCALPPSVNRKRARNSSSVVTAAASTNANLRVLIGTVFYGKSSNARSWSVSRPATQPLIGLSVNEGTGLLHLVQTDPRRVRLPHRWQINPFSSILLPIRGRDNRLSRPPALQHHAPLSSYRRGILLPRVTRGREAVASPNEWERRRAG
jgi:hypothetical protein